MNGGLEQLNEVTAMIAEAREAVTEGELVDLTEIQARVHNICLEIQDSPPGDASDIESKIVAMIEDLNSLAQDLKNQQRSLGTEVINNAVRKAYKMPKGDG